MAGRPAAARLGADQVAEARRRHRNGESIRALAREFGVAHSTLAVHTRAAEEADSALAAGAAPAAVSTAPSQARTEGRREDAHGRALAGAAAAYVEQLEAAYQQAFAAIETLASAIEHVRELRGQEHTWEQANRLGLAPMRPEPWSVRVGHDERLRPLYKRFIAAVNSRW